LGPWLGKTKKKKKKKRVTGGGRQGGMLGAHALGKLKRDVFRPGGTSFESFVRPGRMGRI